MRLIWEYQRALIHLKSDIEIENYKQFLIKHILLGLSQSKWSLVHVVMDHSDPISVRDFEMYRIQWYNRNHKGQTKHPSMECNFWLNIR